MAIGHPIRSPIEWAWDHFKQTGRAVGSAAHSMGDAWDIRDTAPLAIRQISVADLRDVLARGLADFGAYRTDVVFLCLLYPLVGLLLSRLIFGYGMLLLIFPLASGFALIAPFFAVGLCEMSRRREEGIDTGWRDAFGVARSPSLGAIMALGLMLLAILMLWLFTAYFIYSVTLGPGPPDAVASFIRDVLTTPAGWAMAGMGVGVGFLFALLVLTISVVSFPLLQLDRDAGRLHGGVEHQSASCWPIRAQMAIWGLIMAAGLAVGMIPLLFGLAIVLPGARARHVASLPKSVAALR